MQKWAVVVDDPQQAASHGVIVDAEDEDAARTEGARRAILVDRFGHGAGEILPDGEDQDRYELPLATRQAHAADEAMVALVARYAAAAPLREEE